MFSMMDQDMMKQAVDFQKTIWNSAFGSVSLACERAEKMTEMFVNQSTWMTEKWKESMGDLTKVYQGHCENWKKSFETNVEKMENRFQAKA